MIADPPGSAEALERLRDIWQLPAGNNKGDV
jgi:hypothetical protein